MPFRQESTHQWYKNKRQGKCFEQLMPFFHQRKKQEEKDIDKRVNEQPCQQHEFPFFGLCFCHRQIYHFILRTRLEVTNRITIEDLVKSNSQFI